MSRMSDFSSAFKGRRPGRYRLPRCWLAVDERRIETTDCSVDHPSAPTLPATAVDLIDRRRRHGIFCLTRNPSVLKKFILLLRYDTAATLYYETEYTDNIYISINLFSKVPGLLLNNILQIYQYMYFTNFTNLSITISLSTSTPDVPRVETWKEHFAS
jgi:hypothetical protein